MSNLAAIGLILGTLCVAYVVIMYTSNMLNKHVDMIVTGIVEGVPASTKHRYLKLNQIFLTQTGSVIALSTIMAVGYVRIADNVSDPDIRVLAYLAAGLGVFGAIAWLVLGLSFYIQCVAAIRQTDRD